MLTRREFVIAGAAALALPAVVKATPAKPKAGELFIPAEWVDPQCIAEKAVRHLDDLLNQSSSLKREYDDSLYHSKGDIINFQSVGPATIDFDGYLHFPRIQQQYELQWLYGEFRLTKAIATCGEPWLEAQIRAVMVDFQQRIINQNLSTRRPEVLPCRESRMNAQPTWTEWRFARRLLNKLSLRAAVAYDDGGWKAAIDGLFGFRVDRDFYASGTSTMPSVIYKL